MHPDKDRLLVKNFPLLYADRFGDMRETCMYWGFACGDGWFDLIYRVSEKLERIIEGLPFHCRCCGHGEHDLRCKEIALIDHDSSVNKKTYGRCRCLNYIPAKPRASQVKEKYGELCMYLHGGTDEMYNVAENAERESETICESCGQPGMIREHRRWLRCCCEQCFADWVSGSKNSAAQS